MMKPVRDVQEGKSRTKKSRRTKKSTNKKKPVLYTLDPDVILLVERVAYHAGDAKSTVVNEALRRELSKLHSATIPTEWEK
ncbi:hypothetical protein ACFSX6_21385 [Hymenobacter rubripertinctus]